MSAAHTPTDGSDPIHTPVYCDLSGLQRAATARRARLADAAPELLAALEALLADVDYAMPHLPLGTIGLRRIRQAREAIAKAEGIP